MSQQQNNEIGNDLSAAMIRFVHVAGAFGKRACDEIKEYKQASAKATARVPSLVQKLVQAGAIKAAETQDAEALMSTHEGALSLLNNAVEWIGEKKAADAKTRKQAGVENGQGVDDAGNGDEPRSRTKFAAVGEKTSGQDDSDRKYLTGLGLSQYIEPR